MSQSSPVISSRLVDVSFLGDGFQQELERAFGALEQEMTRAMADARDEAARTSFEQARLEAATCLARWPRRERSHALLDQARRLLSRLAASGLQDAPSGAAENAARADLDWGHWPAMVARLFIGAAWREPSAPLLAAVPEAWWGAYAEWLFSSPKGLVMVGDAEAHARHVERHLAHLADWIERSPGSGAVRAAADAYLRVSNAIQLYFASGGLRRHAELRGRVLRRCLARREVHDPFALSREGRRLRVGVVNRHFGPQTETYTTLPTFENLDPERFEVILFSCRSDGSALENHCRARAADFRVMPADLDGQLACLREAVLDVVVFGTNLTAVANEITRLALHRVAPLQVVNNSSCITSGLPEVDLYVSGDLTELPAAAAHFTERLGLLPGPTHAFNYEADRQEPSRVWTKADLGIPEGAVVFASAANYFKIIPEMRETWARLLASVPGSRLLLHPFNPNWSSDYPIKRFCAEFEAVLARHGVDHDRLVVSTMKLPSRSDVGALMAVADVYLDTAPFGGVNSLIDPLESGVPVVAWDGETMRGRMGGALLRALGLSEWVAEDEAGYLSLALRLAEDASARAELSARIKSAMGRTPVFMDTLAASDAFGALVETAYDEVVERGLKAFRADPAPLRARELVALDLASRRALGNRLLSEGRADRAVVYLLAALQHDDGTPGLWLDVARALRANGQHNEALQALEAALRMDEGLDDGWALMAEIAEMQGNHELAAEARSCIGRAAPSASAEAVRAGGHVLLYTDDPEHGGVAQYNHTLLKALVAAGYRVSCAQSRSASPLVAEQAALGVRHHWIGYDTGKEFARTVTEEAPARALFAAERPDLVIFSDCSPVSNLAAREAALSLGLPYLCVVGFVGEYLAKNFATVLPRLARHYAAAREVVAVSAQNLDMLRARFGLAADRGRVVHYGRPDRFFAPRDEARRQALRAGLGLGPGDVLCLTVARLAEVKGHDLLLEAAARVPGAPGARVHFACIGGGDLRASLQARADRLGLSARFHLLGQRWDTEAWYDAADIFALPSRMEGMPLAIMEAMAKRLPVVATAVSGIPEELGDTGRLLPDPAVDPVATIAALSETLSAWAADPAARRALGEAGRLRAEALFHEDRMLAQTLVVIQGQLAAR